jgi:tRNA(Ile)-lysidine synthase
VSPDGLDLEARVRRDGLLRPGVPVLVLLSGGPDSVCLLDVAVRVSGEVRALHVDYGLRDSAAEDAEHCAALCERLGVPLAVHRPRRPEGNVQAWARDVRYAEAFRVAEGDVAAGHTASDQVETVLYRLAASPGRRALLGMRPRDGRLIRPLLGAWRAETEAWCAEHGLPWREDPTNTTRAFARNRTRLDVVPALRALHPAAEANVLRTVELLRDEAVVLEAAVAAARAEAGDPPAVEALRGLPPALARLVVQQLADEAGGTAVGHRTDEILALAEHGALDVGGGLRARIERGRLRFEPTPPRVRA